VTTPPRPTLDETLARINAVLAPGAIDDQQLQAVALHVYRSGAEFADRIGRMEWAAGSLEPTEAQATAFRAVDADRRGLLARAIGWFRR
jgi:hypothetical protein